MAESDGLHLFSISDIICASFESPWQGLRLPCKEAGIIKNSTFFIK
jgi:hypothetical protein